MAQNLTNIASAARVVAAAAIPALQAPPAGMERVTAHPSIAKLIEAVQPLLPHQGLVVAEHLRLAEDIAMLEAFVRGDQFGRVESSEAVLMLAQLQAMRTYEWALRSRVMVWAGEL
jgi:hypothetical protein